jgi:hypothetical protein
MEARMTLCPIALAIHCERCPIVKVCPAKTVLGDFKEEEAPAPVEEEEAETNEPS